MASMLPAAVKTSKRARDIARLAEIQRDVQIMRSVKAKQRPSPFPSTAEGKAGGSTNRHAEFDPSESSALGLQFLRPKITRPELGARARFFRTG